MAWFVSGMICGLWVILGLACICDNAISEAKREVVDSCIAPKCYPDPRPPGPR